MVISNEDLPAPVADIAVDDLRAPHRAHVLICTDPWRDGCASKGALAIASRLRRELRDRGLRMEVRASNTYCQGWCALGPNVILEPQGIWYERVSATDVTDIVEQHLLRGRAVTRLLRRDYGVAAPPPVNGEAIASITAAEFPRTLMDGLGQRVTIAEQPRQVAAVSPGAASILGALVPPGHLVDAADLLRRTGSGRLLLADHDVDPEVVSDARAAGIAVVVLHRPQYVTHIQANIGLAARAVGAEPRAVELNAALDAQMEANRAIAPKEGRPRTVLYSTDHTAAGPYSFGNSLISAAGGLNPVPTSGPGRDDAVPLSIEELAALDPDVVLVRVGDGDGVTAAQNAVSVLLADPRFSDTPAARAGRVHPLDLATFGGRLRSHEVVDVLAAMHGLLYARPAPSQGDPVAAGR